MPKGSMKRLPKRQRRGQKTPRAQDSLGYKSSGATWSITDKNFVGRQVGVQPFPFRYNFRLPYGVDVTMTTAGSVSSGALYRFRLNSMYDPDVTSTGHQPYQYDQLTAIYLYYLVRKAHLDLTFSDPTADGVWVGWSVHTGDVSNDDPSSLSLADYMERPNFRVMPLNNTGAQTATMRQSIPIHEVLGLTKVMYEGQPDVVGAQYNANPSQVVYLDLFLVDPTANVSTRSVRCSGRIVFEGQMWDYAAPARS